ncbi:non-heme ferritin [Carboxylicivirga taeanensis]|uniref:non-heme ferritin n=1 Tax=Carboxylicivirga taeanensis TaxID=1416875 RepID=UPI003F6DDF2E
MLKDNVLKKLNEQIQLEHYSANLYLAMASWCKANGLDGSAKFLYAHSSEEMMHMHKLFNYINETGSMALISAIDAPPTEYKDLREVFEKTFEHEKLVSTRINELVELTFGEKDFSSFNFLQWYVAEQHEEEALFMGILDRMDVIGFDGRGLYMVDKEIGKLAVVAPA